MYPQPPQIRNELFKNYGFNNLITPNTNVSSSYVRNPHESRLNEISREICKIEYICFWKIN
jgi:hypothetical protein